MDRRASGIAAATVQVIGLSRWVLLFPGSATSHRRRAHRDAHHTFDLLHTWLGTVLGETIGYALTATFTVLVVRSPRPRHAVAPDGWRSSATLAAALIATGVADPARPRAASITNFIGYVAWCLWLIAMAVVLWRAPAAVPAPLSRRASPAASAAS